MMQKCIKEHSKSQGRSLRITEKVTGTTEAFSKPLRLSCSAADTTLNIKINHLMFKVLFSQANHCMSMLNSSYSLQVLKTRGRCKNLYTDHPAAGFRDRIRRSSVLSYV